MNEQKINYENKEICKKCGGYCCKKSGCDYFVSDFENMKLDYLEKILNTGRVSIIASLNFKRLSNGKLVYTPILSLRARNNNREIIDLLSLKTRCASLEENGCHYNINQRPGGGRTLIPKENKQCYSEINKIEELNKWLPYQKVLERLVKRYTRMSVTKKLKEDVENLIYNILNENFEEVLLEEIIDIKSMIPLLEECFPKEFLQAIVRYKNNDSKIPLRIKKK